MTLIGQRVGVTTDEVVHGDKQLLVGDFRNLGGGGGLAVLDQTHLAEFVLVEVFDLLHARDFARVRLVAGRSVREGRGVEVVVLRGGVEADLAEYLLEGEVRLHERVEGEAVELQGVVFEGHRVVQEGLHALAFAKGAGEEVVELNVVGIHSVFSYSLRG